MRKRICGLLTGILVLALLTGCGDSGNPRPTETTAPPAPSTSPVTLPETEPPTEPEPVDEALLQWEAAWKGTKVGQTLTVTLEQDGKTQTYSTELTYIGYDLNQLESYSWHGAAEEDYRAAVPQEEYGVSYTVSISCGEKSAPWTLTVASGSNFAKLTWEDGTYYLGGAAEYLYNSGPTVSKNLRGIFDDLEIGALKENCDLDEERKYLIPDVGQDVEDAALEGYQISEERMLQATPGSRHRYSFVKCSVEYFPEETEYFRGNGKISENTWAFMGESIVVPDNEIADSYAWAGNTRVYDGDDPDIPEGALIYHRTLYITRDEDGWHLVVGGTGW